LGLETDGPDQPLRTVVRPADTWPTEKEFFMKRQLRLCVLGTALALLPGCASPKVLVPPAVDLGVYDTVGIVVFTSNATGNLAEYATQKFMQTVQAAQPGVPILELGSERRVLQAIEHEDLDFEAMQAIGKKWGVDAVLTGNLEVTDVKPNVHLATLVKSMSLHADVSAALSTRLVETGSGATVWTNGASGKSPVAHVHLVSHGPVDFRARDPERAYGKLVHALVSRVTYDFYARWERP
jgi:hypothetical protein